MRNDKVSGEGPARLSTRLERRMQFVLGPKPAEGFAGWRATGVAGGLCLSHHPDLTVTTVSDGAVTLTLLGFVLDPDRPQDDDAAILRRLLPSVGSDASHEALYEALAQVGGRYLLIVAAGSALQAVGDASGSLQLFYTTVNGRTWCAAQPDLLADLGGFEEEPEALAFIEGMKAVVDEHYWPVDSTPYAEVRRLLANHVLDLRSGAVRRYWPREPLVERSVQDVVGPIGRRLSGLMAAAAHRFELSMGVSAGLDSRLMLAASRGVLDRMVFYTGQSRRRNARHPDVAIPKRMLRDVGAEHHVIANDSRVSDDFLAVYQRSVPHVHLQRAPGLERQHAKYRLGRVAVLGNTSENARGIYRSAKRPPIPKDGMTAAYCATLANMSHPYAERQFARWAGDLDLPYGYDPRELLYWENRTGSWFAHNVTEFVIAWQDVFLPFNCRALLVDLMSAPAASRVKPATELYTAVVADLWPELLAYPINPVSPWMKLRRSTYLFLRDVKRDVLRAVKTPAKATLN